jgi:hypothetical protein
MGFFILSGISALVSGADGFNQQNAGCSLFTIVYLFVENVLATIASALALTIKEGCGFCP